MMKHFLCITAALLCGAALLSAQENSGNNPRTTSREAVSLAGRFNVSLQGGAAFDYYENAFSYRDNSQLLKLITPQGALGIGFDFTESFGLRLQGAFGTDAGACNTKQTSAHGFYPYSFQHVNVFMDMMLNLAGLTGKCTAFRPKLYVGAGGAYTFGFQETGDHHPWQWDGAVTKKNMVFGFRGGLLMEYCFRSGFGILADFCGEAYTDKYNGLEPTEEDKKAAEGYPGFPFDIRGVASLGIVYHF